MLSGVSATPQHGSRCNAGLTPPFARAPAGWIARQQAAAQAPCSPLTGAPLPHLLLMPNLAIRKLAAGFLVSGLLGD